MTFIRNGFYLIIITNICHAFHIQVPPNAQHVKKTRSLNYAQRKLPILKSAVDEEQDADADADAIDSNPINTSSASTLQSLKFVKLTKQTEPALLADYLMEIGASSVAITDHDADTENENPIFAEPAIDDDSDIFAAVVCGDAAVGKNVWLRCDVTAHFGESYDPLDIVDNVRTSFDLGVSPRYVVDEVPDLDWIHEVQSSWKPCVIGGFVLRLPWHSDEDVLESVKNLNSGDGIGIRNGIGDDTRAPPSNVEDYVQLLLEGGLAFGTGEHPTTQLCLEWITNLLKKDANAKRDGIPVNTFLDYGAGSGVLGMAACKLNNDDNFKAVGVEIDSDAIRIADANALKNQVSMKSYLPSDLGSDDESASLIMKAIQKSSVETLPKDYNGPCFDACAANILAGPLISLSETIASMLKPGAKIGLSGILAWQGEDVVEAYSEYFNDVKVEKEKGGWVLVSGTKK